ncbi:ribokinase [Lactobacillus selangorensis]|nr:ribokinase [Lactobacillus selangorensis]
MTNKVTVLGSLNVDTILQIPRLPKPGETLPMSDQSFAGGGKGANQAIAAARAGADTAFIGKIGTDENGQFMADALQQSAVTIDDISTSTTAKTGQAFILLDENGQNSILVYGGANQQLNVEDVAAAQGTIAASDFLIAQFETPQATTLAAFKRAKAAGVVTILNPAPAKTEVDPELIRLSDLIVPNETESETITGIKVVDGPSMFQAAEKMRDMGAQAVIITVGSKGAYYDTPAGTGFVPAFQVNAVDTTAAGDTFIGALSSQLKQDLSNLNEAIVFANRASSVTVQQLGAQPSIPTLTEIMASTAVQKQETL